MKLITKISRAALTCLLAFSVLAQTPYVQPAFAAGEGVQLDYTFAADGCGCAEGKITLKADSDAVYSVYWADDTKALEGYYPVCELSASDGGAAEFELGSHTAVPSGATKLIAVADKTDLSVSSAAAVFSVPQSRQLKSGAGELLYTFNSYSDVHIDSGGYYVNAEKNWAQALKFAADKNTDFIVSSGDMVTNASGPESEWLIYEKVLSESDYVNPVYESDGNHDMRCGVGTGLASFVRATGLDNTIGAYDSGKPYYSITEPGTGDLFIFMALESGSDPSSCDEFSSEQINWLAGLLDKYYGTGINIYIIQHSPIKGFGAGDRMDNPYYKAHLSEKFISTVQFKALLQKYPELIWMSGHTHEDLSMGYNYSNENGTACHMIHNPAVAGSTWASQTASSLDYNNGVGYNSQGYYVEVYENRVVYYGANLTDELIYPEYSYIMNGARNTAPDATNPTQEATTQGAEEETGATGSTLPEGVQTKRVYFANTLKWNNIDCYSWSNTDTDTCVWPGYGAKYWGTSEQGVQLYYCDIPSSHDNIIWNNAGNGHQTADIELDGVNDFFTPASETSGKNVPVTASVWSDNIVTEPTEESTASDSGEYLLCYYNSGAHAWTDMDTYFAKQGDGTYTLDFTAENGENISCNVYNSAEKTYNCVEASTSVSFAEGQTATYSLTAAASRGKSITVKGLSTGDKMKLTYNPDENTLTVAFGDREQSSDATEPSEQTTALTTAPYDDFMPGDVDMNSTVDIKDATLIQTFIAEMVTLGEKQLYLADVNRDGVVNIKDATVIQRQIAGIDEKPAASRAENVVSAAASDVYNPSDYTLEEALSLAKRELEKNYSFSSYNQYQALKKQYRILSEDALGESESETAKLCTLMAELNEIAVHIGYPSVYPVGDIYYFENTNDWETVNCYAWKGSSEYADWPGRQMQKVGTNNGHDVYGVRFDYPGQYTSLIFNNGTNQTVNIDLSSFEFNCFALDGSENSGKLGVACFSYEASVEPTTAPQTTRPVDDGSRYALCYYSSSAHAWSDIDTFFTPMSDGTYGLAFEVKSSENISLNVYDNANSTYNCVASSTAMPFELGKTQTYSLLPSSSRGKSITVSGLTAGDYLFMEYNPTDNTLKIECNGIDICEPYEAAA